MKIAAALACSVKANEGDSKTHHGFSHGLHRTSHKDASKAGKHQSPIDLSHDALTGTIRSDDSFAYHYGKVSMKDLVSIHGNGAQFNFDKGKDGDTGYLRSSVISKWYSHIDNMTFAPVAFHFHAGHGATKRRSDDGSEHTLEGKHYPLEMHIVHANVAGKYDKEEFIAAVVGVMFDVKNSGEDSFADKFFDRLFSGKTVNFQTEFMDHLNLKDRLVYRGSLTTPPYSEFLFWNFVPRVVHIKPRTLARFKKTRKVKDSSVKYKVYRMRVGEENRNIQSRNGRVIYHVKPTQHGIVSYSQDEFVSELPAAHA